MQKFSPFVRNSGKVLLVFAILGLGAYMLAGETVVVNPPGWSNEIERRSNTLTGSIRVVELKSGETLFKYYDDQNMNPETISKDPSGHWVIVFKNRREKSGQ